MLARFAPTVNGVTPSPTPTILTSARRDDIIFTAQKVYRLAHRFDPPVVVSDQRGPRTARAGAVFLDRRPHARRADGRHARRHVVRPCRLRADDLCRPPFPAAARAVVEVARRPQDLAARPHL